MMPTPNQFPEFFRSVMGYDPFPWQVRLFESVYRTHKWPHTLGLETGSGKTSALLVAVYSMACGAPIPRRIIYVVDRRTIIDEVYELSKKLVRLLDESSSGVLHDVAQALRQIGGTEKPLLAALLRGGIVRTRDWSESISQPSILCSTVDQVGSRLLFRGYGEFKGRALHAALVGQDSLWLLDEVQLLRPFLQTLTSVQALRQKGETFGKAMEIVSLSATPSVQPDFILDHEDEAHPILGPRVTTPKVATLHALPGLPHACAKDIAKLATSDWGWQPRTVAIIVNTVRTARRVVKELKKIAPKNDVALMIGRARPFDRDRLVEAWRDRVGIGARTNPLTNPNRCYVVATQCIEAGVNFDFDAMVLQNAAIDAVQQRVGRVDRDPNPAETDHTREKIRLFYCDVAKFVDPVYGGAETQTRELFRKVAVEGKLDLGSAAFKHLKSQYDLSACLSTSPNPPVLTPALMDSLARTSPAYADAVCPNVGVLLHGPATSPAEVQVAWRKDLPLDTPEVWEDRASVLPPSAAELAPIPYYIFKGWLTDAGAGKLDMSDLETEISNAEPPLGKKDLPVLRRILSGPKQGDFEKVLASEVFPGDIVVVPAEYGGYDEFGFDPESKTPVPDIAEACREGVARIIVNNTVDLIPHSNPKYDATLEAFGGEEACYITELPGWTLIVKKKPRTRSAGKANADRTLATHLKMVGAYARSNGEACALPSEVIPALQQAGELHDIGKADPRFQALLNGGQRLKPKAPLLAKSRKSSRDERNAAQAAAGYPKGMRHEGLSVALIQSNPAFLATLADPDLVLHLVGAHHGGCRPALPGIPDPHPERVTYQVGPYTLTSSSDHGLEHIASGVAERYYRLQQKYGWWGLAYLEAALILADHKHSKEIDRE